jgi:hypothetical protein
MFVQVIQGKVHDAELLRRQMDRWVAEIRPTVRGFLGSTSGITPDGTAITLARFESEQAARANSDNEAQTAWWNEMSKAYDGEPAFHDCTQVDTILGGGSNDAGFVQVMQGAFKDPAGMRARLPEMEAGLREARPDILGITIAWHGDGGFTQAVYFRDEAEARRMEKQTEGNEGRQELMDALVGEMTFLDLNDPQLV